MFCFVNSARTNVLSLVESPSFEGAPQSLNVFVPAPLGAGFAFPPLGYVEPGLLVVFVFPSDNWDYFPLDDSVPPPPLLPQSFV